MTIAHRLRTVIDFDKIIVMDAGCVVEYGEPYELLCKKDSPFGLYNLVSQTGASTAQQLTDIAKEYYALRRGIDVSQVELK